MVCRYSYLLPGPGFYSKSSPAAAGCGLSMSIPRARASLLFVWLWSLHRWLIAFKSNLQCSTVPSPSAVCQLHVPRISLQRLSIFTMPFPLFRWWKSKPIPLSEILKCRVCWSIFITSSTWLAWLYLATLLKHSLMMSNIFLRTSAWSKGRFNF